MTRVRNWLVEGRDIGASLVFLVALVVYAQTAAPTITWRNGGADGGELITAAYLLGIPHPTGYPLYVLLGRLFAVLPLGEVAFRLNLMSAFFAAAGLATVYWAGRSLWGGDGREAHFLGLPVAALAAAVAALMLAFSELYWSQATIAEVYSLNTFFVGLLLYILLRWRAHHLRGSGDGLLVLLALVLGLGMGNHLSVLWVAPAAVVFVAWVDRRSLMRPKLMALVAGAFLVGLTPYLYLPWRAGQHPPISWGEAATLPGFVSLVTAEEYRSLVVGWPWPQAMGRLAHAAVLLLRQFGWPGFILILVGLWAGLRRDRAFTVASLLVAAQSLIFSVHYYAARSEVYLLPLYLVAALYLGLGLNFVGRSVADSWRAWQLGARARDLGEATGLALGLLLPWASLVGNYSGLDLSADRTAYRYATQVLDAAPAGAIVLTDGDEQTFSLWYAHYALAQRPDVAVLSTGLLGRGWYRESIRRQHPSLRVASGDGASWDLRQFIQGNAADRPIYAAGPISGAANPLIPAETVYMVAPPK